MSESTKTISFNEFCSSVNGEKYLRLGKELLSKDVGKAFSLISLGLSLNTSQKEEYYQLYVKLVECWSGKLINSSQCQDALKIFEVAHNIYSDSADLNYLLACTLFRIGKLWEAWQYSLRVLSICKNDPKVKSLVSSLSNALMDRWHFPMINDFHRNANYKAAIEENVQPGYTTVLDIGAGSALLSIYAARAGALKTYACEVNEFMAEMASNVLAINTSPGDVVMFNKHSKDIQIPLDIPERVSLVVTETFDAGLFGEHILPTLQHAWQHLLLQNPSDPCRPARVIPKQAQIFVAIIECDYIAKQSKATRSCGLWKNVKLRGHQEEPYWSEKMDAIPGAYKLLTNWENVLSVDFNSLTNINELLDGKEEKFHFHITADGRGDAILLAYTLFLDDDNVINTCPEVESCWENAVYPIFSSTFLLKDTSVAVHMEFDDVLHFKLSLPDECLGDLVNTQLLKCFNSSSYTIFFSDVAYSVHKQNISNSLVVLDDCPFPQAGISLLEMEPSTNLFIGSSEVLCLLTKKGMNVKSSESLKCQLDVIFYWPFTPEGTLKENILEELQEYRKLLKRSGQIFPEALHLKMQAIQSDQIAEMTRVENSNTSGVEVAQVFNFLKTQHHLDLPLESLSYKPLAPVLHPLSLTLNDAKIIHTEKNAFETPPSGCLVVGEEILSSSLFPKFLSDGRLDGFAYWFELNNELVEAGTSGGEGNVKNERSTREMHLHKDNHHNFDNEFGGQIFNSSSRDSSINQCIFLLEEPLTVSRDQSVAFRFSSSEGRFNIDIETNY